jgi:hypothetical protein
LPQWAKRCIASAPGPAGDAARIAAAGDDRQLLAQEAAQQGHAAVAGAKVLGRVGGDAALADLGFVVAGEGAVLLLAQLPPELAVHLRAHPADVAGRLHPPRDIDAESEVVDRQDPADRLDRAELPQARTRHDPERRHRRLGDADAGAGRRRGRESW